MSSLLVTGANRGLGLAFARRYSADGWKVIATCREPETATELQQLAEKSDGQVMIEKLDVLDHQAIDTLAARHRGRSLDLLINNAGIVGPFPYAEHLKRQRFGTLDYEVWGKVVRTNTFAPVKMAEALLDSLLLGKNPKIVSISSTVGSNVESTIPSYLYGSSKAALNKVMTLLAETLRKHGIIVALLCPGHTKTRMGLETNANIEVEDSSAGMCRLIDELTMSDTGTFTRYNGERIAW